MRRAQLFLSRNIRSLLIQKDKVQNQNQTVYLTHVKWVSGKEQIQKYFSRFGKVRDVSMFFDSETGLHRGFASVTFEKSSAATAAIQTRPHVIDGDLMRLMGTISKTAKVVPNTIFVSRLHWITGRDQLQRYFSQFGTIKDIFIKMEPTGFTSQTAKITFTQKEDVEKLINLKISHKIDEKLINVRYYQG